MYRSRFCGVGVPVVGALGVFVWMCALGTTAEAFDTPTEKPPAAAQAQEVGQSLEPDVAPAVAPLKVLLPTEPTRSTMAGPPANDLCAAAVGFPISDGVTPYDTTGAATDGAVHADCDTAGDGGATVNDIWYQHTASCTGTLTIATCNEDGGDATYDSDLVIYDNTDCLNLNKLGCNDDAATTCTASGTTFASRLIVNVVEDQVYTIRVGGWAGAGDFGPGDLSITCTFCGNDECESGENCLNCPEDCADGLCDGDDTCGTCPTDCGECPCNGGYPGDCDDAQIGIQGYTTQEYPNAGNCWDLDGDDLCDGGGTGAECTEDADCAEGIVCVDTDGDDELDTCSGPEDVDNDGCCNVADCGWTGLAFPFIIGEDITSIDTISFQVNTNFAGGDIYLVGACGICPWDTFGGGEGGTEPDGGVGAGDLAFLLGNWGRIPWDPAAKLVCLDADQDGYIGALDLANLLGNWGDCPDMGTDAFCQPNIFDMRRSLGCAVSGLEIGVNHDLQFDAIDTTPGETIWAVFVGRNGFTGQSALGFFDGLIGTGHQVARSNIIPSQPNNSFANLAGTGNIGDWTDLHELGGGLGTFYCADVSFTNHGAAPILDCVANPEPVGGCCGLHGKVNCAELRGFDCGATGGTYLGDGSTCDDCIPECNEDAGDCCIENGSPGCDDSDCCHHVCLLDPFCCSDEAGEGWTAPCAQEANDTDTGCGQLGEVCEPTECVDATADSIPECIRTGTDPSSDGFLGIVTDEYGAHAAFTWSGGNDACEYGDNFNPQFFGIGEPIFGAALFWYKPDTLQRVVLSDVPNHDTTYPVDFSGFAEIPEGGENVATDEVVIDLVPDTLNSSFSVCGPNDVSLDFTLKQTVEQVSDTVAVWTQVYNITNVSATTITFQLARQDDYDMFFVGGNADDVVGTHTNNEDPGGDLSVYIQEDNRPSTAITLSSPQGTTYWGGKGDVDPDGDPPGGPGPPYGCGTDFQQWDAYGVPEGWANHIANCGYNMDCESQSDIPGGCAGGCSCDGSIGMTIVVTLDPAETKCVCIQHTYGQQRPWMTGTCPVGCDEPFDP